MAKTLISDIIIPEVFDSYVTEKTAELANFLLGGIITQDAAFNKLASSGGKILKMPFYQDLTGSDELLSDSSSLTVNNITTSQDQAVLHMRGKAWSVNDLAKALSGSDPMRAIADLVAEYWARRQEATLISTVEGVMADNIANDSGDMHVDVGTGNDNISAVNLDADVFTDTRATFGDRSTGLAGIAMHSDVYHNLLKLDTNGKDFQAESAGGQEITTYRGLKVIVDDSLPFTPQVGPGDNDAAALYTSYLFGTGAIALGDGGAPVASETDRDVLAGDEILVTRRHFIMHPRGVPFQSASVAGDAPTNAECELAANWDRAYERKNVRIASVITNG